MKKLVGWVLMAVLVGGCVSELLVNKICSIPVEYRDVAWMMAKEAARSKQPIDTSTRVGYAAETIRVVLQTIPEDSWDAAHMTVRNRACPAEVK